MTRFSSGLKTPEEIELEHKYNLLALAKSQLQQSDTEYCTLKSEIRKFEQVYEDVLGGRIQVLEDLEWQLKGLLGESVVESIKEPLAQTPLYSAFHHATDLLDDDEQFENIANLSLKALYRSVAKAVHPDLAADDIDRLRRQELMAIANDAYQNGNRQVLTDLLSQWEQTPASCGSEMDVALELVRVIRQVAAVQQNIQALVRQTEELRQTDIYLFKIRVDDSMADGVDLLAEMAAAVDLNIARLRRRLSTARGESFDLNDSGSGPSETRIVRFPHDQNCGTLFVRKSESTDFRDWQRIGVARGAKEIFLNTSLRLDMKCDGIDNTAFLLNLEPEDLQALFLYGCDDTILPFIIHLTGLQELYLSDTAISDDGLTQLRHLRSLQRISLYHTAIGDDGIINLALIPGLKWLTCSGTSITEVGLNNFRRVMPECKTVSFKWRYKE